MNELPATTMAVNRASVVDTYYLSNMQRPILGLTSVRTNFAWVAAKAAEHEHAEHG
jgi:hypothetical protein